MMVLGIAVCYSQSQFLMDFHKVGDYQLDVRNLMPMRDGSVLVNSQLFSRDSGETDGSIVDAGNVFYKVTRNAEIVDSLFMEDRDMNFFLLTPNPQGEDYIYARAVRNLEEGRTDLCVQFFDDQLRFNTEKEFWVPLCESLYKPLGDRYCLDEEGNMIVALNVKDEGTHLFQIAVDGTLMSHSLIADLPFGIYQRCLSAYDYGNGQRCLWGAASDNSGTKTLNVAILDEELQPKESQQFDVPQGCQYVSCDDVMNWDDHTLVVANRCNLGNGEGPAVTTYDKNTLAVVNARYFSACPEGYSGPERIAYPVGLAKASDGNLFFVYANCFEDSESAMTEGPSGQVCVVKMDAALNVIWQRFFLNPVGLYPEATTVTALNDGGVAVAGYTTDGDWNQGLMFVVIKGTDGNADVDEALVRPYACYPNPVGDALRLEYSPDVTPTAVELYDAQGRLLTTQRGDLESVNTGSLPAGLYTVKVTLDNGKSYSDTVIKK